MYDLKIQYEILLEVAQKTDRESEESIAIDLTDPARRFNFDELHRTKCIVCFAGTDNPVRLSPKGYELLRTLSARFALEQWQQKQVEAVEEANRIARRAKCWSALAALAAVVSASCAVLASLDKIVAFWFS